ncbi:hypothetical protein FA15DRAFT_656565 [Coprinopsis marcescibilis]|uniref:Uncharacterized protein n=1 Tax=Coprinopsis marcescibilis TaxID=230819 RepID=A0A5C3KSQ4_COPMA|nr:hypothetical protein FA15DRAFT_656565 [Coprinopsis marcescibilis]
MAETLHAPPPIAGSISRGSFRDTRVADNFSPFSSVMEYNAMSRQMAAPGAPFLHGVRPGSLYTNATPAAKPRKIENLSRRDSMESFYVEQTHVGRAHPVCSVQDHLGIADWLFFSTQMKCSQTMAATCKRQAPDTPMLPLIILLVHHPTFRLTYLRAHHLMYPHTFHHLVLRQICLLIFPLMFFPNFPMPPHTQGPSLLRHPANSRFLCNLPRTPLLNFDKCQVPVVGQCRWWVALSDKMNIHHATPPRSRAGSDPDSPRRTSFYGSPNDLPPRTPSKDGHHDRHRPSEASKGRSVKRSGTIRRKPPPDSFGPSSIGTPYMPHIFLLLSVAFEESFSKRTAGPGNQLYTLEVDYQWAKMVHGTAKFHGGGFGGRGRLIVEWEIAFHLEKHTDGSDSD